MITFDNLCFQVDLNYPHQELGTDPKFSAAIHVGDYTFSVIYGGSTYSHGTDSYELAVWRRDDGKYVQIEEGNDVIGWVTADDITQLLNQAQHNQPLELPAPA